MKTGLYAAWVAVLLMVASGCAVNKEWGKGTAMGAAIGGAVGAGGGAGTQYGRGKDDAVEVGVGAAVGLAVGMIVGGLVGHYLWDEDVVSPPPPTEAEVEVVEEPPSIVQAPDRIILRAVLFSFDSSALDATSESAIDDLVGQMQAMPEVSIVIEGHTDSIGSDAYNHELGRRRAEAVRAHMVARGVSAGRLSIRSFGATRPVASNDTSDGRAQNRRVEFAKENGE